MNRLFLFINTLFLSVLCFFSNINEAPQTTEIPICHGTDGSMAAFALDPEFQALHPSPMPIVFEALGQNITFKTADGTNGKGYFVKAKKKSKKWLFVYQEWWGLNDHIKQEADKFYKDLGENVNVLALDMYDGQSTSNPQEAGKLMQGVKEPRLENIVNGAVGFAGKKAKIASVGWCFGGSWALKSALLGGKQAIGAVMYYGMPVQDVEKLKTLNCDVLGLFATETRISKEVIEKFAANMKTAGKKLDYKIFEGVHGFANPSNPKHDPALTKEAYGMALNYLKARL